jgi:hypothetical protein
MQLNTWSATASHGDWIALVPPRLFQCRVGGDGLWSDKETIVDITAILPDTVRDKYITFMVFFENWNVDEDGLIYTDKTFKEDFRNHLIYLGLNPEVAARISYTEQGMQGDDYVSMETDDNRFAEWMGWKFESDEDCE